MTPATSKGFSAVEFAEDVIGISLIPWQRWLYIHAFEVRPDGQFRFRTVLVLVARQNGKTSAVEVKNLWKMFVLRVMLVIGTAQILDYAEESWDKAVEIVEGTPELAAEIKHVDKTNGKKTLRLLNGSRWKIAAASRRGGRSLSADDVNLDELREHQNWDSWGAVSKTTLAKRNAQIWAFSNAGDDKSVVLNDLQEQGRAAAESPDTADAALGYFEWSAPDEVDCTCGRPDRVHRPDCMLWDRKVWAQANPSLGYTIAEDAIAAALSTDPVAIFRTEVLCQRVQTLDEKWQVISEDDWLGILDDQSKAVDPLVFAIDTTPERSHTSIAAAGLRADGDLHGEVVDHGEGTSWVVKRAVELDSRWKPARWMVDAGGAAGYMIPLLTAAGLTVEPMTSRNVGQAYAMFRSATSSDEQGVVTESAEALTGEPSGEGVDALKVPKIWIRPGRHGAALTSAAEGATTRRVGDGTTWDRKSKSTVISPLVALTDAVFGFVTRPVETVQPFFGAWR